MRRFGITIISVASLFAIGLFLSFRDQVNPEEVSSVILDADRVDIELDAGASPSGVEMRYALVDKEVISEIAKFVSLSDGLEHTWDLPAAEGNVIVAPYASASDSDAVLYLTLCFTGMAYIQRDRDDGGIYILDDDASTLYRRLSSNEFVSGDRD